MLRQSDNGLKLYGQFTVTLPSFLVTELRRRRQYLGLHQAELADRIGVSSSALGRWERRTRGPTLENLCAWAEECGFRIVLVSESYPGPRAR